MKNIIFTLILAIMQLANAHGASPKIEAQYVEGEVTLDGVLDEKVWSSCLLYTSPSPRDRQKSRMPSSA